MSTTVAIVPSHPIQVPAKVTAGEIQLARFRVMRDRNAGRTNPEPIQRIALITLPTDRR